MNTVANEEYRGNAWHEDPIVRNLLRLALNLKIGVGLDLIRDLLDKPAPDAGPASVKQIITSDRKTDQKSESDQPTENIKLSNIAFESEADTFSRPEWEKISNYIGVAARSNASVVITGEPGTGKEVIARYIHYRSTRSGKPFALINCALTPGPFLERELFGSDEANSPTKAGLLQVANGGTLFLDEIGQLSLDAQKRLLRSLQERTVRPIGGRAELGIDVRIIAASRRPLTELIEAGAFRMDLFYRLNVISLDLAPLRERAIEIPILFNCFLAQKSQELSVALKVVSSEVVQNLMGYSWPLNLVELEDVARYLLLKTPGTTITLKDLPSQLAHRENLGKLENVIQEVKQQLDEQRASVMSEKPLQKLEPTELLSTMSQTILHSIMRRFAIQNETAKEDIPLS